MYIDFEDYRPETPRVEAALSGSTAVLITIGVHVLFLLAVIYLPSMAFFQALVAQPPTEVRVDPARERERDPRFVFVQPRVDIAKPQPKPNVDLSDQDRVRSTIEKPPNPQNPLPFARGNSQEKVEAEVARDRKGNAPESSTAGKPDVQQPDRMTDNQVATTDPSKSMLRLPDAPGATPALRIGRAPSASGPLGEALKNLQRYTQNQSFGNAQGSGDAQGLIQFDSKGADFGPWLRRFVAQVKSNWFIPSAAMMLKGHVVITFNVHRNGALTDIEVKGPSGIDAFDRAAVNALQASNPTQPLPPDYPSESAFFTVTFLYNEEPPPSYYRQ